MRELVVRLAEPKDISSLIGLMNEAAQYKLKHGDSAWAAVPYTPKKFEQRIKQGVLYVAATIQLSEEDELIWGKQPPTATYVHQLAVKDGYHGLNLGKVLIDWASDQAARKGHDRLRIDIPPGNTGLKKYYETQGFAWVEDRDIRVSWGTYVASLHERPIRQLDQADGGSPETS
jgi:GNAT superfamily N-acetyltransferase